MLEFPTRTGQTAHERVAVLLQFSGASSRPRCRPMPLSRSRWCHDSAGARVEFLFRGCCAAGAGTAFLSLPSVLPRSWVPIGTRGPSMSIARSARRWWACGCRRRSRSCGRPRAGIAIRRRSTRDRAAPPPRSAGDYAARVDSMWTQRVLYMS